MVFGDDKLQDLRGQGFDRPGVMHVKLPNTVNSVKSERNTLLKGLETLMNKGT